MQDLTESVPRSRSFHAGNAQPADWICGLVLAAAAVILVALGTYHELITPTAHMSDLSFHLGVLHSLERAWQNGDSILDFWCDASPFGYPLFRTYQHIPHLALFSLYHLFGQSVEYESLLRCSTIIMCILAPLSVWWACSILAFNPLARGTAALAIATVVEAKDYGLGLHNYTWGSGGIISQLWAANFFFPAYAALFRVSIVSSRISASAVLLALVLFFLTCGSHLIAALILSLSWILTVITCAALAKSGLKPFGDLKVSLRRCTFLLALMLAVTSYQWVFVLLDGKLIHQSPHEPLWKYSSHGTAWVVSNLFNGDLFDFGRLPSLTILVVLGFWAALLSPLRSLASSLRESIRNAKSYSGEVIQPALAACFTLWLLMLCGWDLWGWILKDAPVFRSIHLHRLIFGVHAFGILLAACGAAFLLTSLRSAALSTALIAALLAPALFDRWEAFGRSAGWLQEAVSAQRNDPDLAPLLSKLSELPRGNIHVGMEKNWAKQISVGENLRLRYITTGMGMPTLGQMYHAFGLSGDILFLFEPYDEHYYRWMAARYSVAPARWEAPPFLVPLGTYGRYGLFEYRQSSMLDFVKIAFALDAASGPKMLSNDVQAWTQSPLARGGYAGIIEYSGKSSSLPGFQEALGNQAALAPFTPGKILNEGQWRESGISAQIETADENTIVFKVGYHSGWEALVDGKPVPTFSVTPGFVAANLPSGKHTVAFRYHGSEVKTALFIISFLVFAFLPMVIRRRN